MRCDADWIICASIYMYGLDSTVWKGVIYGIHKGRGGGRWRVDMNIIAREKQSRKYYEKANG
jgi:hypothetical protein